MSSSLTTTSQTATIESTLLKHGTLNGVVSNTKTNGSPHDSHSNGNSSSSSSSSNNNNNHYDHPLHNLHSPLVLDNYGSLSSCAHLDKVLQSRAKDTVFETYRQAVLISQPIKDTYTYKARNGGGDVIDRAELQRKQLLALKCTDCGNSQFQEVLICLQCPQVSCSQHSHGHYKELLHMFAIDSKLGLLYCLKCDGYVNSKRLNDIRCEVMGVHSLQSIEEKADDKNDVDLKQEIGKDSEENGVKENRNNQNFINPNMLATTGLKGFVNLGSTCFMSSILQTFIHNPIIRTQFFNNDNHYFNCKLLHDQEVQGSLHEGNACITCSIDKIFKDFFTMQNTEGYGMTYLLATAWYKQKSLAGFQEQDAHEFWQFLLNEFHLDHARISSVEKVCSCISHICFGFELQSCVRCECGAENITVDPPTFEMSLELTLEKENSNLITVGGCLDSFTREEILDTKISCKSCLKESGASRTLRLKTTPPVLSIQLKRFNHSISNDKSSKVEAAVDVPLFLDMNKYTINEQADNNSKPILYELFSVVCHLGLVNTGHYIVYTKNSQGRWFKFDDSVITIEDETSAISAIRSTGYLLYYILHNV